MEDFQAEDTKIKQAVQSRLVSTMYIYMVVFSVFVRVLLLYLSIHI